MFWNFQARSEAVGPDAIIAEVKQDPACFALFLQSNISLGGWSQRGRRRPPRAKEHARVLIALLCRHSTVDGCSGVRMSKRQTRTSLVGARGVNSIDVMSCWAVTCDW